MAAPLIVMDSSFRQRWKLCVRHVVGKSGLSHVCVIVWEWAWPLLHRFSPSFPLINWAIIFYLINR